jgi:hypothetical protein
MVGTSSTNSIKTGTLVLAFFTMRLRKYNNTYGSFDAVAHPVAQFSGGAIAGRDGEK